MVPETPLHESIQTPSPGPQGLPRYKERPEWLDEKRHFVIECKEARGPQVATNMAAKVAIAVAA